MKSAIFLCFFCALLPVLAQAQDAPQLIMPIDCTLGQDCEIQQFMDHDPSEAVRDFGCGTASYDGHKGTDFRTTDAAKFKQGVAVLAAADGVVLGIRDEMPDKLMQSEQDAADVRGRECGNGVVIDHGYGWQTQYCHLRLGSVSVRARQPVKAGDRLGMVGLSGRTQFPHVHLTVRHRNVVIDPFTARPQNESCSRVASNGLWAVQELAEWPYQPTRIIDLGLANTRVNSTQIERGDWDRFKPSQKDSARVAFVRVVNIRKGDIITLRLTGPDGLREVRQFPPLEKNRAQQMVFHGIKRPKRGWVSGTYSAEVSVQRDGAVLLEQKTDAPRP